MSSSRTAGARPAPPWPHHHFGGRERGREGDGKERKGRGKQGKIDREWKGKEWRNGDKRTEREKEEGRGIKEGGKEKYRRNGERGKVGFEVV